MSSSTDKQYLSPEDIRNQYFQRYAAEIEKPQNQEQQQSIDLSANARYIARQAKQHFGESLASGKFEAQPGEEELSELVKFVEDREGEALSETERTNVVASLSASLDHYDILSPLLENPDVNDIIVASYKDVSVQIGKRNVQTDLHFADEQAYLSFVENLLKRTGKACTTSTPVVDAAVDPHVRACVTHETFSPPGYGPMLTLRIARHKGISLDALAHYELAPKLLLEYLSTVVRAGDSTILIAGEVSTGKTTLVRALASALKDDEAILVIEDTHEISLQRRFVRNLLTREANTEGAGRIAPAQAIRTGMRMAMNRVILGEMRDAEAAEAFIDVCASGHSGMSTIHARSAKDAISRLELFLSRAQGNVGIETIRRQIANAVSVVVFLAVDPVHKKRRIMEVVEIGSAADGAVEISPMFTFDNSAHLPQWVREAGVSNFGKVLAENQIHLPHPGIYLGFEPEDLYSNHD